MFNMGGVKWRRVACFTVKWREMASSGVFYHEVASSGVKWRTPLMRASFTQTLTFVVLL